MHLKEVKVSNFKSIKSINVSTTAYNPIVGYNNSGKSNFLRAVNWLLGRSALGESSFNDPNSEVWVEGLIEEISSSQHLLPSNQQGQIAPFIIDDCLTFRRRQEVPGTAASLVKLEVLDSNGNWKSNPAGIDNALGTLFPEPVYVKAMDDASDDVGKFAAKNTIGLLIKYALELARSSNQTAMQTVDTSITSLGDHLNGPSRIQEIAQLQSSATQSLQSFFPGIRIEIDIPPPNLDELIKSANIRLSEGTSQPRAFAEYGHGTQRTTQIALIQLLAKYAGQSSQSGQNTVILIDKPELYLHPQAISIVCMALKQLSASGFQIFFSTHSPMMVNAEDASETIVFWKCPQNGTKYRQKVASALATTGPNQHQTDVLYSLNHSSQWLFCEKPVIVEGKTERQLLPAIFFAITGRSLQQASVSLIESGGSSGSLEIAKLLKSLGYSPKIISDLDFAFKIAVAEGLIQTSDPSFAACIQWFSTNASTGGFQIGSDGLPKKGGALKPEAAYELLAKALPSESASIHSSLKALDIWVWPKGAIEAHLGITKTNSARASFTSQALKTNSIGHALDPISLTQMVTWI